MPRWFVHLLGPLACSVVATPCVALVVMEHGWHALAMATVMSLAVVPAKLCRGRSLERRLVTTPRRCQGPPLRTYEPWNTFRVSRS
jgi:hypothetical protein